ncbi:hypothetical protein [Nitrolancea hollandica]|uniref:hypothetical protein n=1 Tax=Nitrolancea hollandica TaxID=1206749 RepID=UPI0002E6F314|nr:hypothetical protein [Nitrolancea hollandica]
MAKKRYTKFEKEILEILNEVDPEPPKPRFQFLRRRRSPQLPSGSRSTPKGGSLLWFAGTIGLALAAILVKDWSSTLALILAIVTILVFFSPIVMGFGNPGPTGPNVQRWRGKDIEFPPPRAGIIGELRYRIWKMRNGR